MRWCASCVLCALATAPCATARAGEAALSRALVWRDDLPLTTMLAEARQHGQRLLVLLVDGEWQRCVTLTRLRRARGALAATLGRFARVVYGEASREGAHVAERFHVVRRPTLLVIDSSARELGRLGPPLRLEALLAELEGVEDGTTAAATLEAQLAAAPSDVRLQLRAAQLWAARGALPRAAALLELALAADPADAHGWASRALLLRGDLLLLRGVGDATGALRVLAELRRRFPRAAVAGRARYAEARALQRLGRSAAARALLDAGAPTATEHHRAARLVLDEVGGAPPWALAHARRAVALADDRPAYWATLARVQRLAGDAAGARLSAARALALSGCVLAR